MNVTKLARFLSKKIIENGKADEASIYMYIQKFKEEENKKW